MSIRSLLVLLVIPTAAIAQTAASDWSVGLSAIAPSRLLDATDGEVTTTIGIAAQADRRYADRNGVTPGLRARITAAATDASRGANSWSPGAITAFDILATAAHAVSPRLSVDVGLGASLWSAPDRGAPFASLRGLRPVAEVGSQLRLAGPWNARLSAAGTPIGADEDRAQSSGYAWRLLLGVHRDL